MRRNRIKTYHSSDQPMPSTTKGKGVRTSGMSFNTNKECYKGSHERVHDPESKPLLVALWTVSFFLLVLALFMA